MLGQVNRLAPLSPAAGSHLFTWTHHSFQVVLHCLHQVDQILESISGFSSALRMINILCSCKPLGGAGAFLWLPEVSSFHPFWSPAVAFILILGVDTACFSSAVGAWGSSSCCISEKTPISLPFHPLWYCTACSIPPVTPLNSTTPPR